MHFKFFGLHASQYETAGIPRRLLDWNALPEAVVHAKTVSAFKRNLDSHWKEDMIGYGVTKAMPFNFPLNRVRE